MALAAAAARLGLGLGTQTLAAFGRSARQLSTDNLDLKKALAELIPEQQVWSRKQKVTPFDAGDAVRPTNK